MTKRYDVAVVGLQVLDMLVTDVDPMLFSRDSTTAGSISLSLGGDALNQAVTLGQLGSKTALLGAVGNDRLGDTLLKLLEDYPVDVYDHRVDRRTSISIVLIDQNRERHFLRHPGHNDALQFEHLNQEVIKSAGIVSVASAMAFSKMDGEGVMRLLRLAHRSGALTSMDFRVNRSGYDMDAVKATFSEADYLLPSLNEAEFITGETDPVHMAQALRDLGAKHVILKKGKDGCYLLDENGGRTIPALKAKVIDTTGAGDNFAAAFLHGISKGWNIDDCAHFACAAGAIAVENLGASGFLQSEENVLLRMKQC